MEDTKIYLIECKSNVYGRDGHPTGETEIVVSHGVGDMTLTNYCLPAEPIVNFNPKRDEGGMYIDIYE